MKTIAMICMLIDHIGLMFFPEQILWRVVGRLAMPIFAFGIARGAYYTSSIKRYMKKMFVFALISQIPFWWVATLALGEPLPSLSFNIGFTFLWALMIIALVQKSRQEGRGLCLLELFIVVCLLLSAEILGFDYGSYGIIVVLMCYVLRVKNSPEEPIWPVMLGYTLVTYLCFLGNSGGFLLQEVGVLGLLVVTLLKNISEKRIGALFYIFYPAHLLILCVIKWRMYYG